MPQKKWNGIELTLTLLMGGVTFFVCYLFALRGIDPHHDGWMLKTAVDVSRGLRLYADTYVQYGSLYIYLLALGVRIFGETVAAIQIMTCIAYAGCGMLLYRILRQFAPRLPALLSPLIAIGLAAFYFWNFHPWSSVFALLFSLCAALAMVRYTQSRRLPYALLCGVFTGCMFWCRQVALVTVIGGGLILLGLWLAGFDTGRAMARALVWYCAGNLLVSAAFLAVIAAQGALFDWWIQYILNAFRFAAEPTAETAAHSPDTLLAYFFTGMRANPRYDWLWSVLTYGSLVYIVILIALAFAGRRSGQDRTGLFGRIAFTAFALFGWAYYFPTLCYRHLIWSDYPLVGVLALALYDGVLLLLNRAYAVGRLRLRAGALCCALLLLLCGGNLLVRVRMGKARLLGGGTGAQFKRTEYAEEDTLLRYARRDYPYLNGLYLSERETRFYDGLFDAVGEATARFPGKNIVNTTPNPLFSVFTSDNVHPAAFDKKADGYPEQTALVQAYIEREKPIVIAESVYEGYEALAYLTDYNGDAFRFAPVYVLVPGEA